MPATTAATAFPPPGSAPAAGSDEVDIAIVGSGFSGLAMAYRLRRDGIEDFVLLEKSTDVGGTWSDNDYPGCACDVPSHVYSFSFAPNPDWSTTYSPQAEIRDYIRAVADREGLYPHVRFGCEVVDSSWSDEAQRWTLETSQGTITARFLITAPGPLSAPSIPQLPGLASFTGEVFHSARWNHEYDLRGKRVAVVGTGASAIQFLPKIQPDVAKIHLFQRTAPWVLPRTERRITGVEHAIFRRFPAVQRAMRSVVYWAREATALPMLHVALSPLLRRLGLAHLRRQVPDPELRSMLTPDYAPGCKRILISNDYYPALSRENVEVVDGGVAAIREASVVAADGTERKVDAIIFGTGFHVLDMPIADRVRGADGRTLAEAWRGSPQAHRGTSVPGFPNLFMLLGPNTGSGHMSVVFIAEAQSRYVLDAIRAMKRQAIGAVSVKPEAHRAYNESVQRRMKGTAWTEGGCASWYIDDNGLNTSLWPDFAYRFKRELRSFDLENYEALAAPARPSELVGATPSRV
jgi:cation diffusion facilitator CzcD-associated flavoprotein CzcO